MNGMEYSEACVVCFFVLSRLVFLFCNGTAEIGSAFNSILVSNSTFTGQMNHVLVSLKKKYLK